MVIQSRFLPFAIAVVVIAAAFFCFIFYKRSATTQQDYSFAVPSLHYAGQPDAPIPPLRILAFYFVPADATGRTDRQWRQHFAAALDLLQKFYKQQLSEAFAVQYEIYPQPVTGKHDALFYDGINTNRGNPHALAAVREELISRALDSGGDLYNPEFSRSPFGSPVVAILYEGVGSSATVHTKNFAGNSDVLALSDSMPPAFLVSRAYLTGDSYADYGVSIFAHEFGHILGLTDEYDSVTGQPTSDDIMGSGMFRPLSSAFLSAEQKKELGFY